MNLKEIYKERKPWVRKGQFGRLLIVAGSREYTGSPVYNAVSALRAGVDLTFLVAPERFATFLSSYLPELLTISYPGDYLKPWWLSLVMTTMKSRQITALTMGGGLGRELETYQTVREIVRETDIPMVLDAESVRALKGNWDLIKDKKVVLTPHSYEFQELSGEEIQPDVNDRKEKVLRWAKRLNSVILLKGFVDVISDGEKVHVQEGGSLFMTKGGFGDTLAGICGALLARGIPPYEAAIASSFINKKAGEMAAAKYGEGVLASDMFEFIPEVIKKFS